MRDILEGTGVHKIWLRFIQLFWNDWNVDWVL